MAPIKDMAGQKIGHWAVIKQVGIEPKSRQAMWLCRCVCGTEKIVRRSNLRSGQSNSCGCNGGTKKRWGDPQVEKFECTRCHEEKIGACFRFNRGRNRYEPRCKQCTSVIQAKKRQSNDHYLTTKQRNYEMRIAALRHYGGKCACCGEDNPTFLAFDHIANDGAEHRRSLVRHAQPVMSRWLHAQGYPPGFQVLCNNCNWAKHIGPICSHQTDRVVAALAFGS